MSSLVWKLVVGMAVTTTSLAYAEEVRGERLLLNGGGAKIPEAGFRLFVEDSHASLKRLGGASSEPLIVIITYSSAIPKEVGDDLELKFRRAGATHIKVLLAPPRTPAERLEHRQAIEQAHGIFFAGGDQNKHLAGIRDSGLWDALDDAYWVRKIMVGGTSAGTAVMSDVMIQGDFEKAVAPRITESPSSRSSSGNGILPEVIIQAEIDDTWRLPTTGGFGFLPGSVVDQHHFVGRKRMPRLLYAHKNAPAGYIGLAVAEGGAVLLERVPGTQIFKGTVIGDKDAYVRQLQPDGTYTSRLLRPGETFTHDYSKLSVNGCSGNLRELKIAQ